MKKLKCIKSVDTPFKFIKGKEYWFTYVSDPEVFIEINQCFYNEIEMR